MRNNLTELIFPLLNVAMENTRPSDSTWRVFLDAADHSVITQAFEVNAKQRIFEARKFVEAKEKYKSVYCYCW